MSSCWQQGPEQVVTLTGGGQKKVPPGAREGPGGAVEDPWETDGLRKQKDSQYQIEKSASGEGGAEFVERNATPE